MVCPNPKMLGQTNMKTSLTNVHMNYDIHTRLKAIYKTCICSYCSSNTCEFTYKIFGNINSKGIKSNCTTNLTIMKKWFVKLNQKYN